MGCCASTISCSVPVAAPPLTSRRSSPPPRTPSPQRTPAQRAGGFLPSELNAQPSPSSVVVLSTAFPSSSPDSAAEAAEAAEGSGGRITPLPSLLPSPAPALFRVTTSARAGSARSARDRALDSGTLLPSPRPLDPQFIEARRREIMRSLQPPPTEPALFVEDIEVEV